MSRSSSTFYGFAIPPLLLHPCQKIALFVRNEILFQFLFSCTRFPYVLTMYSYFWIMKVDIIFYLPSVSFDFSFACFFNLFFSPLYSVILSFCYNPLSLYFSLSLSLSHTLLSLSLSLSSIFFLISSYIAPLYLAISCFSFSNFGCYVSLFQGSIFLFLFFLWCFSFVSIQPLLRCSSLSDLFRSLFKQRNKKRSFIKNQRRRTTTTQTAAGLILLNFLVHYPPPIAAAAATAASSDR